MVTHLVIFLASQEAESNRLCRRLQLKDIIPVEMQRLTKYPLLLDNIAKYTGAVAFPTTTTTSDLTQTLVHVLTVCIDIYKMHDTV